MAGVTSAQKAKASHKQQAPRTSGESTTEKGLPSSASPLLSLLAFTPHLTLGTSPLAYCSQEPLISQEIHHILKAASVIRLPAEGPIIQDIILHQESCNAQIPSH